jgi:putative SOS response-associated peptidase YedK
MCGRYVASWTSEDFLEAFNLHAPEFEHYNLAPTASIPVIRNYQGNRQAVLLRWGLVPNWVPDPTESKIVLFNARAETLQEKASFKDAIKRRRCLIPARGYYGWKKVGKDKQPYYIRREDHRLVALAGIWEQWEREGVLIHSCAIITTTAHETVASVHERMPIILSSRDYKRWLEPTLREVEDIADLLKPYESVTAYPVDKRVDNAHQNDAGLITPLP